MAVEAWQGYSAGADGFIADAIAAFQGEAMSAVPDPPQRRPPGASTPGDFVTVERRWPLRLGKGIRLGWSKSTRKGFGCGGAG